MSKNAFDALKGRRREGSLLLEIDTVLAKIEAAFGPGAEFVAVRRGTAQDESKKRSAKAGSRRP
jgi:hypothetical protein